MSAVDVCKDFEEGHIQWKFGPTGANSKNGWKLGQTVRRNPLEQCCND